MNIDEFLAYKSAYSPKNGTISLAASKKDFVSILLSSGIGKNLCSASEKNDIIFSVLTESCFSKHALAKACSLLARVGLCMLKYIYFRFCSFVEVYKYIIALKIFKYVSRRKLHTKQRI